MTINWPKQEKSKELLNRALRKWRNIRTARHGLRLNSWGLVKTLQFETNKTAIMVLPNADQGLSRQLYYDTLREWRSTQIFIALLKERDYEHIVDIGANLGYFVFIERLFSEAEIIAVEPVHFNYRILTTNISLNEFKKIETLNCAVGDTTGTSTIFEFEHKNWSTIDNDHAERLKAQGYKCETRKIDKKELVDILAERGRDTRTLIRMDVEGYEYEILKHADFLSERQVDIFVEFHSNLLGREKSITLLKKLYDFGFNAATVVFNEEFGPKSQVVAYRDNGRVQECTIEKLISSISELDDAELKERDGFELFLTKTNSRKS